MEPAPEGRVVMILNGESLFLDECRAEVPMISVATRGTVFVSDENVFIYIVVIDRTGRRLNLSKDRNAFLEMHFNIRVKYGEDIFDSAMNISSVSCTSLREKKDVASPDRVDGFAMFGAQTRERKTFPVRIFTTERKRNLYVVGGFIKMTAAEWKEITRQMREYVKAYTWNIPRKRSLAERLTRQHLKYYGHLNKKTRGDLIIPTIIQATADNKKIKSPIKVYMVCLYCVQKISTSDKSSAHGSFVKYLYMPGS